MSLLTDEDEWRIKRKSDYECDATGCFGLCAFAFLAALAAIGVMIKDIK